MSPFLIFSELSIILASFRSLNAVLFLHYLDSNNSARF